NRGLNVLRDERLRANVGRPGFQAFFMLSFQLVEPHFIISGQKMVSGHISGTRQKCQGETGYV
ncbi:hypothetical protein, partial [Vibrio parahaemolyticus]|uniref:hypothetical protein n=1 Tax=Vibrio parahaemolyticus TaxID=670 RepID=UPI001BB07743